MWLVVISTSNTAKRPGFPSLDEFAEESFLALALLAPSNIHTATAAAQHCDPRAASHYTLTSSRHCKHPPPPPPLPTCPFNSLTNLILPLIAFLLSVSPSIPSSPVEEEASRAAARRESRSVMEGGRSSVGWRVVEE